MTETRKCVFDSEAPFLCPQGLPASVARSVSSDCEPKSSYVTRTSGRSKPICDLNVVANLEGGTEIYHVERKDANSFNEHNNSLLAFLPGYEEGRYEFSSVRGTFAMVFNGRLFISRFLKKGLYSSPGGEVQEKQNATSDRLTLYQDFFASTEADERSAHRDE